MFLETASNYLEELLAVFTSPQKRLFWGYLLSALVIALVWQLLFKKVNFRVALSRIFNRNSWLTRSARADYLMAGINIVIMNVLASKLLSHSLVAYFVFEFLHQFFGGRPLIYLPSWLVATSFTLCLFVLDDLARYWVHRMMHVVPFLWAFHKVHHSATSLNPVTVLRTHPVEAVVFLIRNSLVQGCCIAIFFFFLGNQVTLVTVIGAGVFNFAFNLLGSNLRHSSIAIGFYTPVERILISPAQHQIHHSIAKRHFDKNFGVALALWDYIWKTHCYSEPEQDLKFGLAEQGKSPHTLFALYCLPFVQAFDGFKSLLVNKRWPGWIVLARTK